MTIEQRQRYAQTLRISQQRRPVIRWHGDLHGLAGDGQRCKPALDARLQADAQFALPDGSAEGIATTGLPDGRRRVGRESGRQIDLGQQQCWSMRLDPDRRAPLAAVQRKTQAGRLGGQVGGHMQLAGRDPTAAGRQLQTTDNATVFALQGHTQAGVDQRPAGLDGDQPKSYLLAGPVDRSIVVQHHRAPRLGRHVADLGHRRFRLTDPQRRARSEAHLLAIEQTAGVGPAEHLPSQLHRHLGHRLKLVIGHPEGAAALFGVSLKREGADQILHRAASYHIPRA